jgi:hypothetical protein
MMDNNTTSNVQLECQEPTIQVCVQDRCSCVMPYAPSHHGMQFAQVTRTVQRCEVTIGYAQNDPQTPSVHFGNPDCAANAEVALAMILTFLLKGTFHADIP